MAALSEAGQCLEGRLDWAMAWTPREQGQPSGDLGLALESGSTCLLAVIDGLGHGAEAAKASMRAAETLRREPEAALDALIQQAHEDVRGTRGVVMSLARMSQAEGGGTMWWSGVGNVEGSLYRGDPRRSREALLVKGGTLGAMIPKPRVSELPLFPGDLLMLASDGLALSKARGHSLAGPLLPLALELHRLSLHGLDDALLLLARWNGGPA